MNARRLKKKFGVKESIFVLDSGFSATAKELAEIVGITKASMLHRLSKSKSVSRILVCYPKRSNDVKSYTLTNGESFTIQEIANITGIQWTHINHRLKHSLEKSVIFAPKVNKDDVMKKYTLTNGEVGTAEQFATKADISLSQMLIRLTQSLTPEEVFAPKRSNGELNTVFTLSDGTQGLASELALLAKTTRNTIYNRLRKTNDVKVVLKVPSKYIMDDTTFTLDDDTTGTLNEWSEKHKISKGTLRLRLIKSKDPKILFAPQAAVHKLDNGDTGTVKYFAKLAGVAIRTMNDRLNKSSDPRVVLKKLASSNHAVAVT
jgi:hypothetical protein